MNRLEHLNEVNDVKIYSVNDSEFKSFGRVLQGYDFSQALQYMDEETEIPAEGNIYVASVPGLEALPIKQEIERSVYGGMPIQFGYCNGRNTTFNGFEYHKGSEINIVLTDCMLSLGHSYDITEDGHYKNEDAKVFFLEAGTAIEMYQTTLHLSPMRVDDTGFKAIVVLPKGTNTPLSEEEKAARCAGDPESKLLLQRNKWVVCHPEREPLVKQGAFTGIIGENKEMHY